MSLGSGDDNTISVDQLQVGVYVYLDVGWMHHPFSFNNFKIRNEEQLAVIRQLGLSRVRWDPARSDLRPLARAPSGSAPSSSSTPRDMAVPAGSSATPPPGGAASSAHEAPAVPPAANVPDQAAAPVQAASTESAAAAAPERDAIADPAAANVERRTMMAVKEERIQRLVEHREKIAHTEQAFANAASVVRNISKTIFSQPEKTMAETGALVSQMVDELLAAPELVIQVMSEKPGSEDLYFHSLNVSVLAMIIGRELRLPADVVRIVGMGSLFHDIGLGEIPTRIVNNPGTLTKSEREFREQHCQYGLDIGRKAGLPQAALNIIFQHHEHFDGSGYPRRLKGDAIDPLARLVAIVNAYDNLCNPVNIANAQTPHEALSHMFAQQRGRFDPKFLQVFIRFMGVYPPGTVVGLSNEALGLVIKVNSARPLKPTIVVYDAGTPKHEAIILDLEEEPDINISRAIRPAQLPRDVFDYLSPRRRVSYYFDAASPGKSA